MGVSDSLQVAPVTLTANVLKRGFYDFSAGRPAAVDARRVESASN